MFPNWNVKARREFTPSIVLAGIIFGPRQKLIQLEKGIQTQLLVLQAQYDLPNKNCKVRRNIGLKYIPPVATAEYKRHGQFIPHSCWINLKYLDSGLKRYLFWRQFEKPTESWVFSLKGSIPSVYLIHKVAIGLIGYSLYSPVNVIRRWPVLLFLEVQPAYLEATVHEKY